jgi:peptide/nickel transport system substrate-binding protein
MLRPRLSPPGRRPGRAVLAGALAGALLVAAAPAAAKTLRLNIEADPATLNPIASSELISNDIIDNMYEGLTAIDKDGKVVPALAERWQAHDDGKGFRFVLRRGVKFHSGRELTAADVKWTFEQVLTPSQKGGLGVTYLKEVVGGQEMLDGKAAELPGIRVVDAHTFDIRFTRPDVLFPMYPLRVVDRGVVREHGPDWVQKASAGSGPYRFVHWKRGVEVALAPHPAYWRGAPRIDGVRFLVVPSVDTAISMYEAGELDLVDVPRVAVRRVLQDARFQGQLLQVPAAQVQYLGLNQGLYPPFRDRRVREAVSLVVNRDAIVKGLYGGAAFPLYGSITPGVPGYDPERAKIPYDPERARRLLAEAGYPGGQGLPPVDIQSTSLNKDELAYFANQFKKELGWDVRVQIVERGTFIKAMNEGQVPFFSWGWTADYPDGAYFLSQMWHSRSKWNRPRYANPRYDEVIDRAMSVADNETRYRLYREAEKVLMDDAGMVPLTVRMQVAIRKPNVANVHLTPFRYRPFADVRID